MRLAVSRLVLKRRCHQVLLLGPHPPMKNAFLMVGPQCIYIYIYTVFDGISMGRLETSPVTWWWYSDLPLACNRLNGHWYRLGNTKPQSAAYAQNVSHQQNACHSTPLPSQGIQGSHWLNQVPGLFWTLKSDGDEWLLPHPSCVWFMGKTTGCSKDFINKF